jgi:deoxyribodipyrimidine photolyase-like uncharacterized protein
MIFRLLIIFFLFTSFQLPSKDPFIVVLGTTQDAGYPQIGCDKECCKKYWDKKIGKQKVSCLALLIHQQIKNGYLMPRLTSLNNYMMLINCRKEIYPAYFLLMHISVITLV